MTKEQENLVYEFTSFDNTYIDDVAILYEQHQDKSSTYWGPEGSDIRDRTDLPRTEGFETEGFTEDFINWLDRFANHFVVNCGAKTPDEIYDMFVKDSVECEESVYIVLFTQGGCGVPIGIYHDLDKARKVMRDTMMSLCAQHSLDKAGLVWRTWRERTAKEGTPDCYLYLGNELVYTVYHQDYDATFSVFVRPISDISVTV